jgi:two-component system copper resistance phosphate regulon response regulator CusR
MPWRTNAPQGGIRLFRNSNLTGMSVIRILFIMPNPLISGEYSAVLQDPLYDVDLATAAAEALTLLKGRHFDLVTLDSRLTDMDGCELCIRIRKINDRIPLLMLAPPGKNAVLKGFAAGADDYLPLPADKREFLARIRALLKRAPPLLPGSNKLQTGDIILDKDSREVSRSGKPVAVTASEFLLLEYMMKNKNRIVRRDELVAGAWGEGRCKTGSLSVHINNLRKKLKDGRRSHVIYTVSGKGYLLVERESRK